MLALSCLCFCLFCSFPLQSKGAVLGALSVSQTLNPVPIELSDALELEDMHAFPISPFLKRNKDMLTYTEGLNKLVVPEKLTLEEATGMFEVWKGRNAIGRGMSS